MTVKVVRQQKTKTSRKRTSIPVRHGLESGRTVHIHETTEVQLELQNAIGFHSHIAQSSNETVVYIYYHHHPLALSRLHRQCVQKSKLHTKSASTSQHRIFSPVNINAARGISTFIVRHTDPSRAAWWVVALSVPSWNDGRFSNVTRKIAEGDVTHDTANASICPVTNCTLSGDDEDSCSKF